MAQNKIKIDSNIKEQFIKEDDNIKNISLKFSIMVESRGVSDYNLSKYFKNLSDKDKLKRRKEFLKIISFVKNTKRSQQTLKQILDRSLLLLKECDYLFFEDKDVLFKCLKEYHEKLQKNVKEEKIKASSAETFRSQIISFLIDCFNYQEKDLKQVFPKIINRTGKLKNATISEFNGLSYSKDDLILMVSIFLGIAKHCDYLLNNFINFQKKLEPFILKNYTMEFNFSNNTMHKYSLQNTKTSMLLLAFIALTGSNLTPAISAKRKDLEIKKGELDNVDILLKCNRKNKIQKHKFVIKKKQLKFFNDIIENSKKLDNREDGLLFPALNKDFNIISINESLINGYYRKFKDNPIINQKGYELKVNARILRQSYANQFESSLEKSTALFNSVKTASKHYSNGNFDKNNEDVQNGMNIYTMSLKENQNINDSKIKYIALKDITNEDKKMASSGLLCVNSNNSSMENKFKRKSKKAGFENVEDMTCANVLACFKCENAILIDSLESNYLLLSLKEYLEDSLYNSESSGLFGDRILVKEAIQSINFIFNNQINKNNFVEAKQFIIENGRHPLWETL